MSKSKIPVYVVDRFHPGVSIENILEKFANGHLQQTIKDGYKLLSAPQIVTTSGDTFIIAWFEEDRPPEQMLTPFGP